MNKQCEECGEIKLLDAFGENFRMADGKQLKCQACWDKLARADRQFLREHAAAYVGWEKEQQKKGNI